MSHDDNVRTCPNCKERPAVSIATEEIQCNIFCSMECFSEFMGMEASNG